MKVFNFILTLLALSLSVLALYLTTAEYLTDEERIEMCIEEHCGDWNDCTYRITYYGEDRVYFRVYDESGEWIASISMHDNEYQTFAGKLSNYVGDVINN